MNKKSKEKITLRTARQQDAQRVGDIAVAAWQRIFDSFRKLVGEEIFCQHWSDWQEQKRQQVVGHLERSPGTMLIAEVEGKVVGFLTYHLNDVKLIGTIGNNAVTPEYHNRGIGTKLCQEALEIFKTAGMVSATVSTGLDEGHAPARRMYEKAGFDKKVPHVSYYRKL